MVTVGNGVIGAVGASTYPAEDGELLGAEAAYAALEAELQNDLDSYESIHSYDEYHFNLDEIKHDPYNLLSILCALHEGGWTVDEVRGTLEMLFHRQYVLTENVVVETRYYTETHTDADGNEYEDEVPCDYFICTVTLKNNDLSHLPVEVMNEDQLSRYSIYMATLGNRPDLFPESGYVGKYDSSAPPAYEIPPEALEDETFAAMMAEATKYVGYPYVWGGSSPSTSFDCSGFVSWVLNHSGWNVGRLGAQGLYDYCTPVREPRPGDLVFSKGHMTRRASPTVASMWATPQCCIAEIRSSIPTSTPATGNPISSPTGVYHDWRCLVTKKLYNLIKKSDRKIKKFYNKKQRGE